MALMSTFPMIYAEPAHFQTLPLAFPENSTWGEYMEGTLLITTHH